MRLFITLSLIILPIVTTAALSQEEVFATRKPCVISTHAKKRTSLQDRSRPARQRNILSFSKHFRIHYDVVGAHAVDTTDKDANAIPDYVDSVAYYFDAAYNLQVSQLGFRAPRKDFFDTSSYDVYVAQIGADPGLVFLGASYTGYYGVTILEDQDTVACKSGPPNFVTTSFLIIDNDFSIKDSVNVDGKRRRVFSDTGVTALKITVFHEFQHMIQGAYSSSPIFQSVMMAELTSVWMEHRAFPESKDYLQYMRQLFQKQDANYLTDPLNQRHAGYDNAFFFQYLSETIGDAPVRTMWELIASCVRDYKALDSSLGRHASSLEQEWKKVLPWIYYTGYRTKRTGGFFSNADSLPLILPNNSLVEYTAPSFTQTNSLYPFQFKLFRCILPSAGIATADTVDLLATSTDIGSVLDRTLTSKDFIFTISTVQSATSTRLGSTNYFLDRTRGAFVYDTLFFNGGEQTAQLPGVFPQAFDLSKSDELFFPVPEPIPTGAKITLGIMSPDGSGVASTDELVLTVLQNNRRIRFIKWKADPTLLESGVYIYSVRYADTDYVGKFMVRK